MHLFSGDFLEEADAAGLEFEQAQGSQVRIRVPRLFGKDWRNAAPAFITSSKPDLPETLMIGS